MDRVPSPWWGPVDGSRCSRLLPRLALLGLAFCAPAACQDQGEGESPQAGAAVEEPVPPDTSFILRGTLIDEDANPVEGIEIMAYQDFPDDPGYFVSFDQGFLVNPKTTTDAAGRFELEVQRSFLPASQAIKLTGEPPARGGISSSASPLTTGEGIPIIIKVDSATNAIDLDETVGKITVQGGV